MCAESPAKNIRPCCIGSTTKLRIPLTPFCSPCPRLNDKPSPPPTSRHKNISSTCLPPRHNQILDHFVLRVNQHALPARQARKTDAAPQSPNSQRHSVVHQPLPHHPLAQAKLVQQVRGPLFQH